MPAETTAPSENPDSDPAQSNSSFRALRYHDFRLLWTAQIISVTGSQMQLIAINWHVYLLTKSAFALGLVGLVRIVPIIVCSLFGGVLADTFNRRAMMIISQSVMLASATILAVVTFSGLKSVWPIFLLTAISSAATAFDSPARQALMPTLVPSHVFPNAVSLGILAFHVAMIGGPAIGGWLLASHSPAIVFGLNAVSFLAVLYALSRLHAKGKARREDSSGVSLEAFREGLRFVWQTPIIVQTMTLDFVATFFASATALLPIFAAEILHVGATGFGALAAAPAVGSVITGLIMARIGTVRRQGITLLISVAVYGLATIAFGVSRVFVLSLLMLAITGAADTVSTVLRQTIRQLVTPDYLRGRMTSINMIFFMGGPQLGELEAGSVAALIGAPLSVITGGVGCVVAVAIGLVKAKSLLAYRGHDQHS